MSKIDKIDLGRDFLFWLSETRRQLHRHPELAYHETGTAESISRELSGLGIPHETGVGKTGVVGLIGEAGGKVVALRADMDALPIHEKTDLPFMSQVPGVMHACGHDVNMTIMLGAARYLVESGLSKSLNGGVKLIFQPAEESGAGARAMVEEGALKDPGVSAILACHLFPELALGTVGVASETAYAGSDRLSVTVKGEGGHGARPFDANDPIVAACHFVAQLQTVVSRSLDPRKPAVVTIGSFHAGSAPNVIPETAELQGTIRTFDADVRKKIVERLEELAEGVEKGFGVSCTLNVAPGYPPCRTDSDLSNLLKEAAVEVLGPENVSEDPPSLGAEDFAFFCQEVPCAVLRIGCRGSGPLHSPHFNPDEGVIETGVRIILAAVLRLLA